MSALNHKHISRNGILVSDFSESYKERAFHLWYDNNRDVQAVAAQIGPDAANGDTAKTNTIRLWEKRYDWNLIADGMDEKARIILDEQSITARVEMMKRQTEMGREMAEKGRMYLATHDLESANEAINAVIKGSDLERRSAGTAQMLARLAVATDEQLNTELQRLLSAGDIIDGEVKDDSKETEKPNPD